MNKRTRYFMAGSAAVMAAGLCTGLVAYYAGGFQPVSAAPVATELRYVPADAAVVAYADVRSIMDSELRYRLKAAMPMHPKGQEEFQAQTGIDIEKDIDYIVAAASAVSGNAPMGGDGLVVARGRFNETLLEALARKHGGQVEMYKGKRLVNSPPEKDHQVSLAFLEAGLVAIGTKATVQRAIDAQMSSHSITSNSEMMDLVNEISHMSNAWAVGRFDTIAQQAKLPEEVASRMPPIKWFAASGHVNGGVSGTLRAEAIDEQSADNLRKIVSGALAFGEMAAKSDPKIGSLINSLQLSGSGKTVALSFTVPAELLAMIPQHVEK